MLRDKQLQYHARAWNYLGILLVLATPFREAGGGHAAPLKYTKVKVGTYVRPRQPRRPLADLRRPSRQSLAVERLYGTIIHLGETDRAE